MLCKTYRKQYCVDLSETDRAELTRLPHLCRYFTWTSKASGVSCGCWAACLDVCLAVAFLYPAPPGIITLSADRIQAIGRLGPVAINATRALSNTKVQAVQT